MVSAQMKTALPYHAMASTLLVAIAWGSAATAELSEIFSANFSKILLLFACNKTKTRHQKTI